MVKIIQFEKTITALESVVHQLEKGELSLEESLKQFEHGISLVRSCQTALNQAEQKIQILTTEPPHSESNPNE